MWRGPQWRAQPAAALEKKTRRTRSIAHLAGFAHLGEDRESGGPQIFFFFFGTKKKKKFLNPLYPFSQKNSVQSVQALQYPVYHPLSSASYTPPFTSPFDRGVHAPPPHQPHPPPSTHSSPYPNQKKKKPCARRRLMTRMYHVRSQHGGATKKPPQCHATPVPLFVPSRRPLSRATHEVPSQP